VVLGGGAEGRFNDKVRVSVKGKKGNVRDKKGSGKGIFTKQIGLAKWSPGNVGGFGYLIAAVSGGGKSIGLGPQGPAGGITSKSFPRVGLGGSGLQRT